ncbi:hypothetical protein [Dyella sp. 2HG41-7]|uniref:hypothetical protein n=1 Tax=Dyella sp. 2HG41-7 TaxID=2883239 RepID=UPI001F3CE911|nr:hypothetical protein [Dyella sp. 2HG41-7]
MTDTIELLEAIGQNASLRYASTETLTEVLEQAQASEALTAAVITGDSKQLFAEFGRMEHAPPQSTQQTPGHEEEEEEIPAPPAPAQPPTPGKA